MITADADRCLLVYPLPDWELIQQKLEGLSNLDPRVRELQRRLIGFAVDVDMDGAGRVLISPALREYAQLDKAVVLVGQGKKFELWNKDNWEQMVSRLAVSARADCPRSSRDFRCERLAYPGSAA